MEDLSTLINLKDFTDFPFACKHFGIEINNNQLDLFKKYYEILLDWNQKINLISRTLTKPGGNGNNQILEKHFLDSILFLPEIKKLNKEDKTNLFDIGSGGGFPAIPLAIMNPEWDFVLCESIKKKAVFLNHVAKNLGLEKFVKIINARVEVIHELPLHKNKYALVTARAIAKSDELIKYSLPLLKPGGSLIAYKSKNVEDEIKEVNHLLNKNDVSLFNFSKTINDIERKLILFKT